MDRQNIQNIYPLSPVATALLYRREQSVDGDPGLLHVSLQLKGEVDARKLRDAWQEVTNRHEAMRSSIHWEEVRRPMVVVHKEVPAAFDHHEVVSGSVSEFKRSDRKRGVELTRAPIDRLALISASSEQHDLIWTTHHLLLDGWSAAVIIEELLGCYAALRSGNMPAFRQPPERTRYEAWLDSREMDAAESFWSSYLSGFTKPTRISTGRSGAAQSSFPFPELHIHFSAKEERQILQTISATALTLSGILQTALAVCMDRLGAGEDIVFGMTTSGRPAEVPDIDRMTGLFVSTVPVRVALVRSQTVREIAADLLKDQAGWSKFAFVPMERIAELSELPAGTSLFDCLLVIENFPWQRIKTVGNLGFELVGFEGTLTTTLPLTVAASDTDRFDLRIHYDPAELGEEDVRVVAETLKRSVLAVSKDPDRSIAEVIADVPEAEYEIPHEPNERTRSRPSEVVEGYPADETELVLARLWSEVLGIRPILPDDDFFDLGGRSIQAVRLFSRIEEEMNRAFPISALFEGRTLRKMTELLRDGEPSTRWKALVPIQPFGSRPALFCMHAGEGNVNFYYDLAQRLGPDQPVYGVQAVGLDGETPPLRDIGEMADLYADEILTVQQGKPCVLAGTCLGTMLAVEVSERLEAGGCEVLLNVALDTAPIDPRSLGGQTGSDRVDRSKPGFMNKIVRQSRNALNGDWYTIKRLIRRRTNLAKRGLAQKWTERFGTDHERWQMEVRLANNAAAWTYTERPVNTPVLLIRSTDFVSRDEKTRHLEAWKQFAVQGLDVKVVESRHKYLLEEPQVARIAEMIGERIAGLEEVSAL